MKNKSKKVTKVKKKDNRLDSIDTLYKAVANYIKLSGGEVLVINGIEIGSYLGEEQPRHFVVQIECFGHKPVFPESEGGSW